MKFEIDKKVSAQFLRVMKEAPLKAKKAFEIGLRRCGDQMRNEAGANAPYKTGNLKRSITLRVEGVQRAIVGTNLVYARIHDQGGEISAKNAKYLTFKVGGKWVRVKRVRIKPVNGKGYLTPAFNKLVEGDAEKIFTEEIKKAIS